MPVHQGISRRIWTQTLESKNNNFNNFKYYIHLSHRRYIKIKDFNTLPDLQMMYTIFTLVTCSTNIYAIHQFWIENIICMAFNLCKTTDPIDCLATQL
jgi:hypothetical protein